MTSGITTWKELGCLRGPVLAVLNSPPDDPQAAMLFDQLEASAAAADVHVIAGPAWRSSLAARRLADDRVLLTVDGKGREIELNHFLETPAVVRWAVSRQFRTIVGSGAHALYNDEVKDVFEQRVSFLLGDGRFLAHTLPGPHVYVLDLSSMLRRLSRAPQIEAYSETCRALIDDLCLIWRRQGKSAPDDPRLDHVVEALERQLGSAVIAFDEVSPVPLPKSDTAEGVVALVKHLQLVLFERDQHLEALTDLYDECNEAVNTRDALLVELHAERVEAVNLRDRIIDDLRREGETMLQRWRRKLRGSF